MFTDFQKALSSGDLELIFGSLLGQIIIVVIGLALLLLAVGFAGNKKGEKVNVKALTYSSIAIAISYVLSNVKLFALPQGGSLTPFSMLFVITIAYFFGVRTGVLAGVVYGLLQLALGGYVFHPIQILLDYPLAFGALGLAGIFANQKYGLIKGVLVASLGRFICHFISGVVFFGQWAPEGWNSVVYSIWYNFSYVGVEGILTAILVAVPVVAGAFNQVKKQATA